MREYSCGEKNCAKIIKKPVSGNWSHPRSVRHVIEELYKDTVIGLANADGVDLDVHHARVLDAANQLIALVQTRP